jgi:hypothetical protein
MAQSTDPGREIALLSLQISQPTDMLDHVIRYAFDQLCWRRSSNELDALLKDLRAFAELDEVSA